MTSTTSHFFRFSRTPNSAEGDDQSNAKPEIKIPTKTQHGNLNDKTLHDKKAQNQPISWARAEGRGGVGVGGWGVRGEG